MSLILPSAGTPRPQAQPTPNASALSDTSADDGAGSFGAVLARSLEPAGKAPDKDNDKSAPVKRQAEKAKTVVEDLINAMAIGLVTLESRIVKAVPSGDAAAVTVPTAAVETTATTLAASATSALAGLTTSVSADATAAGAALSTDTARQSTLASAAGGTTTTSATAISTTSTTTSATSATGAKPTGPSALAAAAESTTNALAPGVVASQNAAPESGLGGQSEPRGRQGARELNADQLRGATQIPAALSTPASESVAISVVSSQSTDEAALSTDATLPGATLLAPPPGAAALAGTGASEAASTATLAPDVGSSDWGQALGQQIVKLGKAGQQIAELQLNPPGLGPLKVTLNMNDQQMQASFVSAHASVRVAIEAALPQLRSTLADSGISLGNTSVSSESQQQQAFTDRPGEQASPRSYRTGSVTDAPALAARLAATPLPRAGASSGSSVDTYA